MRFYDVLNATNIKDTREVLFELDRGKSVSVFGLGFSGKLHLAGFLSRFVLYVAPDISVAGKIVDALNRCGKRALLFPERGDVLLYNRSSSAESVSARLSVLGKMIDGEVDVVVATPASLMNYVPSKERFIRNSVLLTKFECEPYSLAEQLVTSGYKRVEKVEQKGEFAVRGDIFDVFPVNCDKPVRLEFFGDEITDIRYFDAETMRGDKSVEQIKVYPACDMLVSKQAMDGVKGKINLSLKNLDATSALRKREITEEVISRIEAGEKNIPWLIPYLRQEFQSVFDYIPDGGIVAYDECKQINDTVGRLYDEHFQRTKSLLHGGEITTEHVYALIPKEEVFAPRLALAFQQITTQNPIFNPDAVISFRASAFSKYYLERALLYSDVNTWVKNGYKVLLATGDKDVAEKVYFELLGNNVMAGLGISDCNVSVCSEYFPTGIIFHKQKLVVIGTDDLIRKRTEHIKGRKRDVFTTLNAGDYAVHDVHGIGLCMGVVKMETYAGVKDYVEVDYKNGKLYVPVEQINQLQRYSGSDKVPQLSTIGGKEFAKVKARVKASIGEMAVDLIKLYKDREKLRGYKYEADNEMMQLFEDSFPYAETEDQIRAIADVKSDMEKGKLMDRLICGDVGYGKTEVALRAVFKAVENGKQCAILAPTTILSQQHYNTCKLRFEGFPLEVEVVNRFKKPKEIKNIIERLKSGDIDVVCGTHRLLSKDVAFCDLGLLVLDEEQRFGVADKEKIKDMKKDVDVITMSATPIPRTLHMSLSGIRDISVLETPPENRLPVQTFVTEYNDNLVRDCVNRELARGGQCFILYNKVESIDSFAEKVRELLPEVKVTVCHGQMDERELEVRISEFYNGDSDVLVSTTIIENGIDLPNANTLIIYDADLLGLSQLYQLRGRVGRGDRLAYAYFTYREGKVLSENAYKRLEAIMDYTELGSGFKIAMRDLEIRGAGNVLGREQHGHMEKVGYDMYCKLLGEVLEEMEGKTVAERTETEMKVELSAGVPKGYLAESEKIKLYRTIADITSKDEIAKLVDELKEMCKSVPEETENLMYISYLRNMACKVGVSVIACGAKGAGIKFPTSDAFRNRAVLFATAEANGELILSESKSSVIVRNNNKSIKAKLQIIQKFLEDALSFTEN